MSIGTVFVNNRTQAVRLPLDVRLPEGVQKVDIRVKGKERIIAPIGQSWDSFFLDGPTVSDDFLPERATQHQPEREALPARHQHHHLCIEAAPHRGALHLQRQRQPHGNVLHHSRRTLARCREK